MKKTLIFILKGYTTLISPVLHQVFGIKSACRYDISCSEYALKTINDKGIIKGTLLSGKRFINCQPYFKI